MGRRNKHHANIVNKLAMLGLTTGVVIVGNDLSDELAFALEKERIDYWKAQGIRLANQATGGRGGMSGCKRSEESRRKQSKTMKGRPISPAMLAALQKNGADPEIRKKIGDAHRGMKRSAETCANISAGNQAVYDDPIRGELRRAAVSTKNKGRKTPEETRAKQRAAKTPEIRAMLAEIVRAKWAEPGERERRSAAMSVANTVRPVTDAVREAARNAMTPERRKNSSVLLKQRWADPIERKKMNESAVEARTGKPLSSSHVESLKRSWTPERKKIVSDKMKAIRAQRQDWGK
jgi:hypothetical protein